jgi:hypothetical protein
MTDDQQRELVRQLMNAEIPERPAARGTRQEEIYYSKGISILQWPPMKT